jgi:hypothetical protein
MAYSKKKTTMKPMNTKTPNYKKGLQHDVEKAIKPDKIKPKQIFDMNQKKKKSKKKKSKY